VILDAAETWGVAPWEIARAKLGEGPVIWLSRWAEWRRVKGMRDGG
jgi:hypothetical protein